MKIQMNKKDVKRAAFLVLRRFCNMGYKLTLPVPIKKIAKSFPNIRVIPYSRYMRDANITEEQMYRQAGTDDAYTDYDMQNNQYIICYNDLIPTIMSSNRYRWNIAHELGHIVLNHHKNGKTRLFRNALSKSEYYELEKEANWFAAYILVPYIIIQKLCHIVTVKGIRNNCRISNAAAAFRKQDYDKWERMNPVPDSYDQLLLRLFYHSTVCHKCKLQINDSWKYCPICGNNDLFTNYSDKGIEGIDIMMYDKLKNKDGVLTECPICKNEEIIGDAEYCHICSAPLKNKCYSEDFNGVVVQCDKAEQHPIPVNARYCPYCASESLFLSRGMIKRWNDSFASPFDADVEEVLYDEEIPF